MGISEMELTTSFYPFSSAFDRECCILIDPVETLNGEKKNSVINFLRKVAEDSALKLNTARDTLVERNEEIEAIGIKLAKSNVRASRFQSQRDTGQNSINSLKRQLSACQEELDVAENKLVKQGTYLRVEYNQKKFLGE